MADDYGDLYDVGNMSDEELKDLVIQELREYPELDVDLIEVDVRGGAVKVSGRIGTEQEIQQVERVLTDVVGIERVSNELVLDDIVRGERSQGADDAWAEEQAANEQTGSRSVRTSDEAAHLLDDIDADQYGTEDPQEATERGTAYEPPSRPVQEGSSREDH